MLQNEKSDIILRCFKAYTSEPLHFESDFYQKFSVKKIKKGAQYLSVNKSWDNFSVIINGIFRLYYLGEDGKQHTKGIFHQGNILAPCAPSAINCPSTFYIESFVDSEILTADYQTIREQLETTKEGRSLLIGILESLLNDKVDREFSLLTLNAESRYLKFMQHYPEINEKIPKYIIANFLGMTDVTLSRIRKKLNLT
jgi:CRP-like cAMP-binding protein